jgi:hypothetical protein
LGFLQLDDHTSVTAFFFFVSYAQANSRLWLSNPPHRLRPPALGRDPPAKWR